MKYEGMNYKSERNNWKTPKGVYGDLNIEFSFDFDPCPKNPKFNGLKCDWGSSNFCNPPYEDIRSWLEKGIFEWATKNKTCVFLLPVRTSVAWWHDLAMEADEIRFIEGRLRFSGYKWNAGFDSCLIIYRSK